MKGLETHNKLVHTSKSADSTNEHLAVANDNIREEAKLPDDYFDWQLGSNNLDDGNEINVEGDEEEKEKYRMEFIGLLFNNW